LLFNFCARPALQNDRPISRRKMKTLRALAGKTIFTVAIAGLVANDVRADDDIAVLRVRASAVFAPLPAQMPGAEHDTRAMIKLGRQLYLDKRLSAAQNISCDTCHSLESGGAYGRALKPGEFRPHEERDSPTVMNAGFQFAQFWDGRAANLVAQVKGPMFNPDEMGMPAEAELLKRLRAVKSYQTQFPLAFPDAPEPVATENIARAIAAFERTLISHDRFDDFLKGDDHAIGRAERKGLEIFLQTGCQKCHDGSGLGGNSFQKIGVLHPYANTNDVGRAKITGDDTDRYRFKVPSLRNVALTAPYFHDGKIDTLDNAVRQMAYLQLGKTLSDADVEAIENFLRTLTDKDVVVRH
jgi:cytochrome c peroxidase